MIPSFFKILTNPFFFVQVKEVASPTISIEFKHFLRLFHHMLVISKVFPNVAGLEVVATKASVSLFRFADLIPANRAFYEAGANAKVAY